MMMKRPSPSRLVLPPPTNGSPSANSSTTQTGRPSMWTESAQRKLARLYVYTTLPLHKIVELVHSLSPEPAPGTESANKKLNNLLDKEPRWLRPKHNSDMGRRVNELSNSPTRLLSAAGGQSRSTLNGFVRSSRPELIKVDDGSFRTSLDGLRPSNSTLSLALSPQIMGFSVSSTSQAFVASLPVVPPNEIKQKAEQADSRLFSEFLRRTTCLSNSTDRTTGSFHRVLGDYSEPYIQAVKTLVKRFTAPIYSGESLPPSPSDYNATVESWISDEDCAPAFHGLSFPIPGDYLFLDEHTGNKHCYATHEAHVNWPCLCPCYIDLDNCVLPWVDRNGLTAAGEDVLTHGPTQQDTRVNDAFGNTVLHFLSARGSIEALSRALQTDFCKTLIAAKNSAGQTFLHVLNTRILENPHYVLGLLHMVRERDAQLLQNCDCYGRSFFHLLRDEKNAQDLLNHVAIFGNPKVLASRDAFGFTPAHGLVAAMVANQQIEMPWHNDFHPVSNDVPGVLREARLLEIARLACENPLLQDAYGRNGLHCLAMASLSSATVASKYRLRSPSRERVAKKQQNPENVSESCTETLKFRLGLLMDLLNSGVDPNHCDGNGNTPLMVFVAELPEDDDYKTPPKIVEALIRSGANVNARNRRGETALHVAVRCGRKLAMKTLVRLGANVHVSDSAGRSLLDVADAKLVNCRSDEHMNDYAHYEACRAWLSGTAESIQKPTVIDEWGVPQS